MRTAPHGARRVVIQTIELRHRALDRYGIHTNGKLAGLLGVDRSTMTRLLAGTGQPSAVLIATILDTFDAKFEDLFTIVPLKKDPAPDRALAA
jgi:DNA-binding XRE family transcriptional regulator